MVTVKVIERKTGNPIYYRKVAVIFNSWTCGAAKDQYTDRDGEAHFSEDNGDGIIYVQGRKVYEGKIE